MQSWTSKLNLIYSSQYIGHSYAFLFLLMAIVIGTILMNYIIDWAKTKTKTENMDLWWVHWIAFKPKNKLGKIIIWTLASTHNKTE